MVALLWLKIWQMIFPLKIILILLIFGGEVLELQILEEGSWRSLVVATTFSQITIIPPNLLHLPNSPYVSLLPNPTTPSNLKDLEVKIYSKLMVIFGWRFIWHLQRQNQISIFFQKIFPENSTYISHYYLNTEINNHYMGKENSCVVQLVHKLSTEIEYAADICNNHARIRLD